MNAITLQRLPEEPFTLATNRVNEWRGICIDHFTRIEMATTKCLATLSLDAKRGAQVRLPHLVGQRLEALASLIRPEAPFADEGKGALPILEKCIANIALRTMLCHGTGKVTLDARGEWTYVLRLVAFRSKMIQNDIQVITEGESEALRDDLKRLAQDTSSRLGQIRAHFR
ncbi:hypothetical protein HT136_08825 [Novosphingobium profundi]|uniref:hypothetical protein n=1 Tax=Novosphingobium profundi TaxID=1774954 RepID=UPI001BD95826|nr:hypothetical protein [Novosphingobium profundi]MBT0668473.1 hypothetical protein [Novosphingobium profundi]